MPRMTTEQEVAVGAECVALAITHATKHGVPVLAGTVDAPDYLKDPSD